MSSDLRLTRRGEALLLVVLVALIGLSLAVAFDVGQEWKRDRINQTVTCVEDMPCWDCEVMGNGICGPSK